jgi:hypothetical protein
MVIDERDAFSGAGALAYLAHLHIDYVITFGLINSVRSDSFLGELVEGFLMCVLCKRFL